MDPVAALVADVRAGLRERADPEYVQGTVAARSPAKPVLGVRIPLLRDAVKAGLKRAHPGRAPADPKVVLAAADVLWHGAVHEEELAACKMLRLAELTMTATLIHRWAALLDNWLSVDEMGAVVGDSLVADLSLLDRLVPLAVSSSSWERRLYVVSLIAPVKAGLLHPARVPHLASVLGDADKPVRKASTWLINQAVKARPAAAGEFREVLPGQEPKPLVRLLVRAGAQ